MLKYPKNFYTYCACLNLIWMAIAIYLIGHDLIMTKFLAWLVIIIAIGNYFMYKVNVFMLKVFKDVYNRD